MKPKKPSTKKYLRARYLSAFALLNIILLLGILPYAYATVTLAVTAFSCSPNEVPIRDQFTCTATVQNSGDAAGSLTTATLYPDGTNWLESSSYPETVSTTINAGNSAEIVFDGLKAKKAGLNGFSQIVLDESADTFVASSGTTVNVIDVLAIATSSASSAIASASVDVTGQTTVGGNVNDVLSFSVTSGGCSIGSQASSATTNGMTDAQTTSHTWSVTMGTSNCVYLISSKVTSTPGNSATKTDTASGTITCSSGCTSSSPSPASSGGGGGGGGAASAVIAADASEKNVAAFKTQVFAKIEQGANPVISLDKPEIAVNEIKFTAVNALSNVEVKVSSLKDKPTVLPAASSVYQYLEIAPKNLKSTDVNKATITFKVTKYWLNANGFKESDVALSRYASNFWSQLPTTAVSSDAESVTYSADTPGFSYFAIVSKAVKAEKKAEEKPKEPEIKKGDDQEKQAAEEQKKSSEQVSADKSTATKKGSLSALSAKFSKLFEGDNIIWTTVVLGVIVLLGLYFYPNKKR